MRSDYALWVAAVAATAAFGTWASLALWGRFIRHEEAEARALVAAREAEALAGAEAERRAVEALAASERRHRALTEAGAIAAWRADAAGRVTAVEGWQALTGLDPAGAAGSAEAWLAAVAEPDRGAATAAWRRAVADGTPLDIEFRVAALSGGNRWCRARAVPVPASGEWIGVVEDIDGRRRAEEARMLLAREVNHRAKNMLAVVQAVVRLTRTPDPTQFAAAVSARIAALGRAHDLLSQRDWGDVELTELARGELAAWIEGGRLRLEGPAFRLTPAMVQPMAIALHELATNAAKYGALSPGSAGSVGLGWAVNDAALRLVWEEHGGPPVAPPERRGFGTRVIDASITDQLGGRVEREWLPEGLRCTITLPLKAHEKGEEAEAPSPNQS